MSLNQVRTTLSQLKEFGLALSPPEDFIYLGAKFCDALGECPIYQQLRHRAGIFDQLTGPESTFEDARSGLSKLCAGDSPFKETQGDRTVWCGLAPQLTLATIRQTYGEHFLTLDAAPSSPEEGLRKPLLPTELQRNAALLRWWCVGPATIHDSEWVRCNLHSVFAITEYAVRSQCQFHPPEIDDALLRFRDQVWQLWRKADREHLFGSFLLATCQDAVNAGREACQGILRVLNELDLQAKAACDAAEDLCHCLESSADTLPKAADVESTVVSASENTIDEVIISSHEKCWVLKAASHPPFVMTVDETVLFAPLVRLIATETATGFVTWETINGCIGQEASEWRQKQHPEAAKEFSLLNKRLRAWGIPPNGADWIDTKRGKNGGRYLNRSVRWLPDGKDEILKALARKSPSISGPLIDPHKVGRSTPDRGHKLPARPRRNASHNRNEAEDEDS